MIIDGKAIAAGYRKKLSERVGQLKAKGITPGLAVILVGDDPASASYVKAKEKACSELGLYSDNSRLPAGTTQQELLALVREKNADPSIHGILVQLPLPRHIDEDAIIMEIDPEKDVDAFHPLNVGKLLIGKKAYLPCTPHGVLVLLEAIGVKPAGSHVVVVGRSNIVGKPVANLLLQKNALGNATVTVCHTGTRDLALHTKAADILIAAAGSANMIGADMVKDGAVVIDVGVNRIEDQSRKKGYRLVGDVDFETVAEKASWITPVPGGVGPMTITMLLANTIESAENHC